MSTSATPVLDSRILSNPYPAYARLREEGPVHYMESLLQSHVVCRYADIGNVLKNTAVFSSKAMDPTSRHTRMNAEVQALLRADRNLVAADPPLHTRMRAMVGRAFTPRRVAELEPRIRQLANELLDTIVPGEDWDFVNGLAAPLPIRVIAEMLGVESERHRDFRRWSNDLVNSSALFISNAQSEQLEASVLGLLKYLDQIIAERRREPRGDLISALVEASGPEEFLSARDLNAFVRLLLVAGNETTTNLLSGGLLAFLRHPAEWERLMARPELVPNAVEEMLRYDAPLQGAFRLTTQATEIGGQPLPEGARLLLLFGAANRDPDKFPDPERFDITRDTQGHYSLGHGIHFCLGAPLARLEAKVVLEEILRRGLRFEFAPGQAEHLDWGSSFILRGLKALRVRAVA